MTDLDLRPFLIACFSHLHRVVAVLVPQKLLAPLYKSLGLVMRPVTADAAATAGLAR